MNVSLPQTCTAPSRAIEHSIKLVRRFRREFIRNLSATETMQLFVNTYDFFSLMQLLNEDSSVAVTNLDIYKIQIQQGTRHATTN